MYTAMCDTTLAAPVTIKEWYDGVGATYVDPVDQRPVTLQRVGDPDLTLWAVAAGERLVWSADIGSYSSEASPSVAEGKVYVPAAPAGVEENGGILCFNASTGEQLWIYQPTETSFAYNPLPVDGSLYVGSPRTCLNWTSGSAIWTAEGWGSSMSAPAAYEGGQLYTVRGWPDEHMRCSLASDGTEVWESQRGYAEGLGAPTIADGRIYLSGDDRVKCVEFEAESVSETWDYQAEGNLTEPSVANGTVYVGSRAGELIALDAATGALRWREVADEGLVGTLAVAGGNIYACTRGDRLAAFTTGGNLLWETESTVGGWTTSSVSAAPAVTDDYVYVTGGQYVECIDTANGQVLWEYTPDQNTSSWSAPVVSGGYVYMMGGGKVYCIRAQEGDAGSWPMYKYNPARTGAR
jgi:outer membrane protein assembly factor BamB